MQNILIKMIKGLVLKILVDEKGENITTNYSTRKLTLIEQLGLLQMQLQIIHKRLDKHVDIGFEVERPTNEEETDNHEN